MLGFDRITALLCEALSLITPTRSLSFVLRPMEANKQRKLTRAFEEEENGKTW